MKPRAPKQRLGLVLAAFILVSKGSAQSSIPSDRTPATDHPRRRVVVSIPDKKLAITEDGRVIETFSVAVGAPVSPSPTGRFEIVRLLKSPTYYHPGVIVPAGKGNPLGPRWIGLSQKGYGIHGTNELRSIGKAASHGCIRMRNRDIVRLFEMVRVGDVVEIRGERDEEIAAQFGPASTVALAAAPVMGAAGGGQ